MYNSDLFKELVGLLPPSTTIQRIEEHGEDLGQRLILVIRCDLDLQIFGLARHTLGVHDE